MFWYIIICSIILYLYVIASLGKTVGNNADKLLLKLSCTVLLFFMGMRGMRIGVDTKFYGFVFSQFSDISWSEVFSAKTYATAAKTWTFDFEPGYRLLNKVLSFFGTSPQIITFFNSLIIIVLLYFWIKRESPNPMLSIWIYITLGFFQTEMNVTRNAIAIFIVYLSFRYIEEKYKYIFLVILAAMFHKSAVVFLPFYWIYYYKERLNPASMIKIIILGILMGLNFQFVGPIIRKILPFGLDKYFTSSNDKAETLIVGLLYVAIIGFLFVVMKKSDRIKSIRDNPLGSWMFTLNISFFGLNIGLGSAARMAAVFGPYIIVYIPQIIESIADEHTKKWITWFLVFLCGIQYILRLKVNNIGKTMPYRFFWS